MQWQVRNADGSTFDATSEQLRILAKDGRLKPTDMVWRDGFEDFVPAGRVKGLFPAGTGAPTTPPPATVAQGEAPAKKMPVKTILAICGGLSLVGLLMLFGLVLAVSKMGDSAKATSEHRDIRGVEQPVASTPAATTPKETPKTSATPSPFAYDAGAVVWDEARVATEEARLNQRIAEFQKTLPPPRVGAMSDEQLKELEKMFDRLYLLSTQEPDNLKAMAHAKDLEKIVGIELTHTGSYTDAISRVDIYRAFFTRITAKEQLDIIKKFLERGAATEQLYLRKRAELEQLQATPRPPALAAARWQAFTQSVLNPTLAKAEVLCTRSKTTGTVATRADLLGVLDRLEKEDAEFKQATTAAISDLVQVTASLDDAEKREQVFPEVVASTKQARQTLADMQAKLRSEMAVDIPAIVAYHRAFAQTLPETLASFDALNAYGTAVREKMKENPAKWDGFAMSVAYPQVQACSADKLIAAAGYDKLASTHATAAKSRAGDAQWRTQTKDLNPAALAIFETYLTKGMLQPGSLANGDAFLETVQDAMADLQYFKTPPAHDVVASPAMQARRLVPRGDAAMRAHHFKLFPNVVAGGSLADLTTMGESVLADRKQNPDRWSDDILALYGEEQSRLAAAAIAREFPDSQSMLETHTKALENSLSDADWRKSVRALDIKSAIALGNYLKTGALPAKDAKTKAAREDLLLMAEDAITEKGLKSASSAKELIAFPELTLSPVLHARRVAAGDEDARAHHLKFCADIIGHGELLDWPVMRKAVERDLKANDKMWPKETLTAYGNIRLAIWENFCERNLIEDAPTIFEQYSSYYNVGGKWGQVSARWKVHAAGALKFLGSDEDMVGGIRFDMGTTMERIAKRHEDTKLTWTQWSHLTDNKFWEVVQAGKGK